MSVSPLIRYDRSHFLTSKHLPDNLAVPLRETVASIAREWPKLPGAQDRETKLEPLLTVWRRRRIVAFACVALLACGSNRAPPRAPRSTTPPRDASVLRVDAPDTAPDAPPDAPAATLDVPIERSDHERLVRALASGATPFSDGIDPVVGVVSIRYLASSTLAGGVAYTSRRDCGAAITRTFAALQSELAEVVRAADRGSPFRCAGDECVVSGDGSGAAWHLRFRPGQDLPPRLELVALVSEAAADDVWNERARALLDRGLNEARTRACAFVCVSRSRDVTARVDCIVHVMGGLDAAVSAHGYLGLAELAAGPGGDPTRAMRAYVRRSPGSPLAARWRSYFDGSP